MGQTQDRLGNDLDELEEVAGFGMGESVLGLLRATTVRVNDPLCVQRLL